MAKFRRNHYKGNRKGINLSRLMFFILLALAGLLYISKKFHVSFNTLETSSNYYPSYKEGDELFYLPATARGQIIQHGYYSLSYVEEFEQAEWVAYELTRAQLDGPRVPRAREFNRDPLVRSGSSFSEDYSRSGYTRGHLVPAGDMSFSSESMKETFFTSNISPQKRAFNGGIWRELEENTRDWARKYAHLYIVTGPVLTTVSEDIGKGKIAVPSAFYKVILDLRSKKPKSIAFVIPNELSEQKLDHYAVTVDEAEEISGIDFFPELLDGKKEEDLESKFNINDWPLDEWKYKKRIEQWNNQ